MKFLPTGMMVFYPFESLGIVQLIATELPIPRTIKAIKYTILVKGLISGATGQEHIRRNLRILVFALEMRFAELHVFTQNTGIYYRRRQLVKVLKQ